MQPFINRTEAAVLAALSVFLFFGVYFSRTNLAYFNEVYTVEDGLVETLSVVGLLTAAAVCFARVVRLAGKRSRWFLFCTALLGTLFLFGAGEELSWGQRLFSVESPEFFQANNAQAETNLHNLVVGGVKINKLVFGTLLAVVIVLYVLVLPVVYRRSRAVASWTDAWAVPVPRLLHALSYLAVFAVVSAVSSKRHGELLELAGCALFCLIVLFPHNRSVFAASKNEG